ncbi:MAG TPA: hypothetical protein DEB05_10155 [Firmicutes bacterium]|jgi:ribosomal protein L7Ae-like RNA K-turn-binding protein|nr:hypothetical protein [Bacillota bacterium]
MKSVLNLLGITRKAGKLTLGFTATSLAIKKGRILIVVMTKDSSPNTTEKIERLCKKYQVDIYYLFNQIELGRALGKSNLTVVGVASKEMASTIKKQILSARME